MTAPASRTIMVPLDGSTFAEQALPLAMRLACSGHRRIALVLAQHIPLWPDEMANPDTLMAMKRILHAEGETYLRTIQHRFQTPDVPIDTITLSADNRPVGPVLNRYLQEAGIGLVVMATHGRGGVQRAWLGSVADYLVRHIQVPVLLTRPGCAHAPEGNRILVPLDGSPLAESVLEEACTVAREGQHEIVLLQVVQPVMRSLSVLDTPYTGFDEELTAVHRSAAEDYLDDVEGRIRARGITCTGLTMLAPSVAEAIVDVARPAHFVMIAIASHGRGGLRRLVLGSVADKVVRSAELPVLVHRPAGSTAAEAIPVFRQRKAGPLSCAL